ncbi:lysozyme-like domain-containing protein [Chytriomyces sp. MP71]|nr:lysozyme-like domain-containing protein [Chytriomyces sp. MP71]
MISLAALSLFVASASAQGCIFGATQCDSTQTILQQCSYGSDGQLNWINWLSCGTGTVCSVPAAGCVPGSAPASSSAAPKTTASPSAVASSSSSSSVIKPSTSLTVVKSSTSSLKSTTTTSVTPPSSTAASKTLTTTSVFVPPQSSQTPTTTVSSSGLPACGSAWSTSQAYPSGSTVSVNKINFNAKWYENVGSNPVTNADGGWSTVGPCDPTLPVPSGPGGKPPVATNLAGARVYAASLSQDPTLLLLKSQVRTNSNIDGISPGNPANPDNVKRVERIVTPTKWAVTYFSQADPAYTYTNFLKSVGFFAGFCDTYTGKDSDAVCKRLLATMFAHFAQETGAHSKLLPIPEWQQSLVYLREISCTENNTISGCYYNNDCGNPAFNKVFPCGKGPSNGYLAYFGRGAHQLSYSFNYGPFSEVIYNDPTVLLNNPALVADTWLNIASAIFFFIYPQPPKPSMLGVMDGSWIPNASDAAAGRTNDFPSTIQIINGECAGSSLSNAASNRISFYQSFAADMGLNTSKESFKCSGMGAFDTSSAGVYPMYWTASYLNQNECQLVSYQTNFNALMDGPNYDQYVKCVELSFNITLS